MSSEQGFQIIPSIISTGECERLIAELLRFSARGRAGARHLMKCEPIAQLSRDPRLVSLASIALGRRALPFRVTLFEKSGRSNWLVVLHQDTALPLQSRFELSGWGPWSVKAGIHYAHAPAEALSRVAALRVHLDDSTSENGPLRIIPGSHIHGLLSDEAMAQLAREVPPVECVVPAGGVLLMRPLHVHSSSKSKSPEPRRVLHIEYVDSLNLGSGILLAIA